MPPFPPDAAALLGWYDRHRRTLPFRATAGRPDPYHVWVSEVMLQQTTVAAVGPRFARFLARFPDVAALAAAPEAEVMEEWAGLGYYARARNLHAASRAVVARGGFPGDAAGLRALPGIGPYTAAAIAAIAFNEAIVPVDGNVERVVARLTAEATPLPQAKPILAARAQAIMEDPAARARPGDLAQALFDLGATICTPRAPSCLACPWAEGCAARAQGISAELPRKTPKPDRPLRHGVHFLLVDGAGRALFRRRPPRGLLGGMLEIPGTPWRDDPWGEAEALEFAPGGVGGWARRPGLAHHGFTHFELSMALYVAESAWLRAAPGEEVLEIAAARRGLPTVMRRLLGLASA